MHNITKLFPGGIFANRSVDCEARTGEIHGILGENGAGKTTLMKILAGLYRPDAGMIEIDGQVVNFHTPRDAKLAGVGMVHQHFSLVNALTVADNLALSAINTPFFLKPKRWAAHLRLEAERLGIEVRPDAYVWQLSMGERQRVEIFRLILEGARILILDEPTSILAPQEAEHLFYHLQKFASSGHTVFLVTHKINQVKENTDRVTVLRQGRVVATSQTQNLNEAQLAELMVGRSFQQFTARHERKVPSDETVLEVKGLTVKPLFNPHGLVDFSFTLRSREILGVAGISGNGQDELVAALTGITRYAGVINRMGISSDQEQNEVGYIPADRRGVGVALDLSVGDNLSLRDYHRSPFTFGPFIKQSRLDEAAREKIAAYEIRPDSPGNQTSYLSGGNIQKLVLAREMAHDPKLIVAVTPTAGLDVATVDLVHREIIRHAGNGAGALIVSEDLDELLEICHRILVIYAGRLVGAVEAHPDRRQEIGLLMSGLDLGVKTGTAGVPTERN